MAKAAPNSSAPTTAEIIGGVYNVTPPVLTDGQATALQVDVNGKLVTSGGGGGGGNVNITGVNGVAPALNNPLPVELSDGTNAFGTSANPISENVAQWGGTAVSAPPASGVPAVGTEVAPVVKPIQRKNAVVVTTVAPAINTTTYYPGGVTSPTSANWYDSGAVGAILISLTAFNNPASQSNSITVEQADDTADTVVTSGSCVQVATFPGTNGSNYSLIASVVKRYWRIKYINGATLSNTSFKISFTEQSAPATPLFNAANALEVGGGAAGQSTSGFGNSVGPAFIAVANTGGVAFTGPLGVLTYKFTPATGAMVVDRQVETFKTASIAATSTTTASNPIWTPAAGKKFRLMRFQITAQGLAANASAAVTVTLVDSATTITIGTYDIDVPLTANIVSGVTQVSGWIDLGNGYLSLAANNVLNFGISAAGAGTVGTYRINACGTEE